MPYSSMYSPVAPLSTRASVTMASNVPAAAHAACGSRWSTLFNRVYFTNPNMVHEVHQTWYGVSCAGPKRDEPRTFSAYRRIHKPQICDLLMPFRRFQFIWQHFIFQVFDKFCPTVCSVSSTLITGYCCFLTEQREARAQWILKERQTTTADVNVRACQNMVIYQPASQS